MTVHRHDHSERALVASQHAFITFQMRLERGARCQRLMASPPGSTP